MTRKKLELHLEDAAGEPAGETGFPWKIAASALIVLLAVFLMYYFFATILVPAAQPAEEIQLSVSLSAPLVEGMPVSVRAFSTCGQFTLYLDGQLLASGERVAQPVSAKAGRHRLLAQNAKCNASAQFETLARECAEGEKKACMKDGCGGTALCENGRFSPCVLPPQACLPGQRVGCPLDGCSFGYRTCNSCGTGYGPCRPPGAPAQGGCNSTSCT